MLCGWSVCVLLSGWSVCVLLCGWSVCVLLSGRPEPPVLRTVQDTPRHCGCANRAADRSCLAARRIDIHIFLSAPGITSKEQLPGELRNLTLALTADRFPHTAWTHVYTDGSAEEGMKNGGSGVCIRYSDGDTTSLSVPGGLQCSNYRAEILAISTAAEHLLESRKKM